MRLDAVYVLAPMPKPPSVPTRRAFLMTGAAFVVGAGLGGACGYSIGAAAAVPASGGDDFAPSGDEELDDLRRLAVKAPIEELVEKRFRFLMAVPSTAYRSDPILWKGVERLCDAVLGQANYPSRRVSARAIAQVIESCELTAVRARLMPHVRGLREIR